MPTLQNDHRTTMLQSPSHHMLPGQGRIGFPSTRDPLHHGTFHSDLQSLQENPLRRNDRNTILQLRSTCN